MNHQFSSATKLRAASITGGHWYMLIGLPPCAFMIFCQSGFHANLSW